MDGDLYSRSVSEELLKCIGPKEAMPVMAKAHEGIVSAHQGRRKMKWLIWQYGYFWPTIKKDCSSYAKGCEACQKHGPIQYVPA